LTFLLAAGALTLGALALLIVPLMRSGRAPPRAAYDLEVYRDQLAEVERDRERGLISPREAAGARVEIERRILEAGRREQEAQLESSPRRAVLAAIVVAMLLPAVTGVVYLQLGAPHLPDRPLHARDTRPAADPEVAELAERLQARVLEAPDDVQGWTFLGRTRAAMGEVGPAIAAYRTALELRPDDPALTTALAETLVMEAQGAVTSEAEALFRDALAREPELAQARYYVGLAAAQAGDQHTALEEWRSVLAETPSSVPWRAAVEAAFVETAEELGLDGRAMLAEIRPAARGPAAEDMARAAEMDDDARAAMVEDMVAGLAARLEQSPDDLEGWLRLGRSRLVLGQEEAAFAAFERAVALAPEDARVLKAYADARLGPPVDGSGVPEVTEAAAELYARAAEAAPEDPEPVWFLGLRALQQGDREVAIERWEQVLALLDPDHPDHRAVASQLEAIRP
jgi:cytochrome c-type biogenesis protein CcmH